MSGYWEKRLVYPFYNMADMTQQCATNYTQNFVSDTAVLNTSLGLRFGQLEMVRALSGATAGKLRPSGNLFHCYQNKHFSMLPGLNFAEKGKL